jgi:hypothetical protein
VGWINRWQKGLFGASWTKKYLTVDAEEINLYKDSSMKKKDSDTPLLLKHIGVITEQTQVTKNEPLAFDVIYVDPKSKEQTTFTLKPYDGKKMTSEESNQLVQKLKARVQKAIDFQVKQNELDNRYKTLSEEKLNEMYINVLKKQAIPESGWQMAIQMTTPEQKWGVIKNHMGAAAGGKSLDVGAIYTHTHTHFFFYVGARERRPLLLPLSHPFTHSYTHTHTQQE